NLLCENGFWQFHYSKRNVFMPFLLAEILNFQGSTHLIGVGSLSYIIKISEYAGSPIQSVFAAMFVTNLNSA
ncbi:MAG TPA: hypothetical protein H9912_10795, partial [Candidatus Eisenbergiella stercorigallinarum]|nr:hypothetical protein [Candidatus Eisenbergiella stercorigallinarum]